MIMATKKKIKEAPKSARHKKVSREESPSKAMKAVNSKKKKDEDYDEDDDETTDDDTPPSAPQSRVELIRHRHEFLKKEIDKIRSDLEAESDD